jgi:hypothetical protein
MPDPENHDLEQQETSPNPTNNGPLFSTAAIGTLTRKSEPDRSKGQDAEVILVDWEGSEDPEKPRNWSIAKRLASTIQISVIATALACAAGIDAAILPQAAAEFGVSDVAESMSTGESDGNDDQDSS